MGAPYEGSRAQGFDGGAADTSLSHSGAVFVFVRDGTVWTQQAHLTGRRLQTVRTTAARSVDGDQTNAANGTNVGAAFVFGRAANVWVQQSYLKATDSAAGDGFGNAASISGDGIAVGAYRKAEVRGAAYMNRGVPGEPQPEG